jgi:hypothetical protein
MSKQAKSKQVKNEQIEPAAVAAGTIAVVAACILTFLSASMGGLWLIYTRTPRSAPTPAVFPQPRLQTDEGADLRRLLAQQHAELNGYRWANAAHTLIDIPIERAMQLIAARGADGYAPIANSGPQAEGKP